jgi:16S rRNA G1207 methylase RsmC
MSLKHSKKRLLLDPPRFLKKAERRSFFDNRVEIYTKRRLRKVDILLLECLPPLNDLKVLCVSGSKGVVALAVQAAYPSADVHDMEFESPVIDALNKWKLDNEMVGPEVKLVAELREMGQDFDVVLLPCSQNTPRTLIAEFIDQCRSVLKPKGQVYAATDSDKDDWLRQALKKGLGVQGTRLNQKRRYGYLWKAVHKAQIEKEATSHFRRHNFNIPDREALTFMTRPGLRSHDKAADETFALMDFLATRLEERESIVCLNCGPGFLGLFLAASNEQHSVMMLDTSARAVDMSEQNRGSNGIDNAHVLLDTSDLQGVFAEDASVAIVLGIDENPANAEESFEKAFEALAPNGRLFLATRDAKRWGAFLKSHWQGIEVKRTRKLTVFQAQKKSFDEE